MNVFLFNDYRELIRRKITESSSIRGYQTKLAQAAGCQTSYLSRALNGKVHLTPEHAAGLCQFWAFDNGETQFYLQLVQLSRAGTEHLRNAIRLSLDSIRARNREIDAAVKLPSIKHLRDQALYYSKWYYAAVHMLVLIKDFNSASKVADRLKISAEKVMKILGELESMHLISKSETWFEPTQSKIHIPKSSPLFNYHVGNWYLRAIDNLGEERNDSLHYSAVHSLSKSDIEEVRSLITGFIKSVQTKVNKSREEDVVCFSCSFFRI